MRLRVGEQANTRSIDTGTVWMTVRLTVRK